MYDWLITLKPVLLVAIAMPAGLITATVGQWCINWAREPSDQIRETERQRSLLKALLASLQTAKRYCDQMKSGISNPNMNLSIPTFNLDLKVLEIHSADIYSLFEEENAAQLTTTRQELAHVRRRIDMIEKMTFVLGQSDSLNNSQKSYLQGTSQLLDTTIKHCDRSICQLEGVEDSLPEPPTSLLKKYWRHGVLLVGMILFFVLLCFVAGLPDRSKPSGRTAASTSSTQTPATSKATPPVPSTLTATGKWWFSLDTLAFAVAAAAFWVAWNAFRASNHVILKAKECSFSYPTSIDENNGEMFTHFAIRIQNKGITLFNPHLALRFQGKDDPGTFTLPLRRTSRQQSPRDELAKGMVVEFHLKSYEMDDTDYTFLRHLQDAAKQNAYFDFYSQGYHAGSLRVSGFWDKCKSRWNSLAFQIRWKMKREVGKNSQGAPIIKEYRILPEFTELQGSVGQLLSWVQRESSKSEKAGRPDRDPAD